MSIGKLIPAYMLENSIRDNGVEVDINSFELEEVLIGNVYKRTLHIPKGIIAIGGLHKLPCFNIVEEGEAVLWINGELVYIEKGNTFISPPTSKKIVRTLSDLTITNIIEVDSNFKLEQARNSLIYEKDRGEIVCH